MKAISLSALRVCSVGAVGVCLLLGSMSNALALESPDKTLNLNIALQRTLEKNSLLQAFPYYVRISDAQLLQAELSPAPKLGMEVANIAGSGDYSGSDQAEFTLTLGQTLELGGKRQSRLAVADAKSQALQADYEIQRLDILSTATGRYYELLRLQALRALTLKRVDTERQALDVVRQRARAGATGQADVSKMQLRLAHSVALASRLDGQQQRARQQLSALWMAKPDFVRVAGNLADIPDVPDVEALSRSLEDAPEYARALNVQRVADSQLLLEKARGRANLDVGIGVRYFERTSDQALVLSASMPLYFENPNRGNIAAAQARQALADQQLLYSRQQLELSLLDIQQSLTNHFNYAGELANRVLPQAQQLLRDTEAGYRKGRYSVLQWVDAQSELFNLQRELIETQSLIFLQFMELERLTGQSLLSSQ
ncbi:MAG: TolC family protein [Pseudomonadota bacterium]